MNIEPHEAMSYKKQIDIASKVGELLVGMTGKTLSKDEQDDMFKDIFEQTLRLMSRFTSDVVEAMYDSTENWDEFLELDKNMEKFGFGDAISFMESGLTVCLTIEGKTRMYFMEDGKIICGIKDSHVNYVVTKFYTDAVLSKEWSIYEP